MDKQDAVYIYTIEHESTIIKEGNNAICSNMDDPEKLMLNEVRERQVSYIT